MTICEEKLSAPKAGLLGIFYWHKAKSPAELLVNPLADLAGLGPVSVQLYSTNFAEPFTLGAFPTRLISIRHTVLASAELVYRLEMPSALALFDYWVGVPVSLNPRPLKPSFSGRCFSAIPWTILAAGVLEYFSAFVAGLDLFWISRSISFCGSFSYLDSPIRFNASLIRAGFYQVPAAAAAMTWIEPFSTNDALPNHFILCKTVLGLNLNTRPFSLSAGIFPSPAS